jgi:plastocyanin|tara:strand:- start:1861 stop:6348 length:4488 start_codon:yes stop_codon:yes gene_type:complete
MATLGNDKITGLSSSEITSNNNAVSKSYADNIIPLPANNSGSVLSNKDNSTIKWSFLQEPFGGTSVSNTTYSWGNEDLLVAFGQNPSKVAASTDNINWSIRTTGATTTTSSWADAGWVNGYWYRVQGDYLGFSTDSVYWETRTSGVASGGFCPGYSSQSNSPLMHYKNPYYFTSNWSNQIWSSTDTIHWEQRTHLGSTIYSIGCYAGNALIGSNSGQLSATTDWYHWSYRTSNICGNIQGFVNAGNFVMGVEETTCYTHSNPYYVDLKLSTDTIHWDCCHTGYKTCCYQTQYHPRSLGFSNGVYYTTFNEALGSGYSCRYLIISSTDTVHWETSFDACTDGSPGNTSFAGNSQRLFATSNNIILSGMCKDGKYGFLFAGGLGDKQWTNISQSCNTETVSRRGSVTLDSNTCPFFKYSFPKETQFLSIEAQLAGNVAPRCIGNSNYSSTKGTNGGSPGIFAHLTFNRCQLVLSDSLDNSYKMGICGSTFASCVNMPLSSGLYGSNDMENFYMNTAMMPCTSGYNCAIRSGLDSSGNHVIMAAGSCMISSLDGGRTWSYRTRGSGNYTMQDAALYIDGCPGNFLVGFYCYLCHTTDTIHWECRPGVSCNNGYIFNISYQNSKYWASGYNFLSCSADGVNWCKRTVTASRCWSAFAYDSSGGYLIGARCSQDIAHSTDSIHWESRTNLQICYSGFRYCNSKWYSFGAPNGYSSYGCTKTWSINQSTDSIHWEAACCLPIRGSEHPSLMNGNCAAKITACTLGPNNETFVNIMEPVSETMEPFVCDQANERLLSQSLKSTTDFIHWTDHSKKLPTYRQQQLGCAIAITAGGCILSMHYSSDTELFLGGGVRTNVNACERHLSNNNIGISNICIVQQTKSGTCTTAYYDNQGYSGNYCYRCYACQTDYLPGDGAGSGCFAGGSGIEIAQSILGGDSSRVNPNVDGFPGVQCSSRSDRGRKGHGFDFGVGGASSGGSTSVKGPGGGVCSTLGNIPATDIDVSELKQYEITVSANGSSGYTLAGEDRGGTFSATNNKSLTIKSGDLVIFTLDNSVSGHPFWIKRANSTGTTDRVLAKFVKDNGSNSGEIILDTYDMPPGTYHYNCQYHSAMHGTITVEDPVVNLDGEDGIGTNASLFGTGGAGAYVYKTGFGIFDSVTPATPRYDSCDCQNRLFYANNNWFYTGYGVQISTDTVHWKIRTVPFTNGGICGRVTYGNSNWLVINGLNTGRCAAASTDSIHWDLRTLGTNCAGYISGLAYANNLFMAKMCYDVTVSTDTIHWQMRTLGSSLMSCERQNGIAYGNGLWATIGGCYGGSFVASTDTIHWDLRTHGLQGWYVYNVSYANGYWFINGENCMSISTDTIHWNNRQCMGSPPTQCTPVIYNGEYYMFGGSNGCLAYRKNLVATHDEYQCWLYFNDFMGSYVNDDIHGLAVGDDNTVMVADGQNLKVMSNQKSRTLVGNGGNGCNGGGPGAGGNYIDEDNGWAKYGENGQGGDRRIRITWW